uniref:Uncharacterized protein n=1 Tax=Ixodes ricinus TaxID=34613 RepID=A0A6B0USD6_IXORI
MCWRGSGCRWWDLAIFVCGVFEPLSVSNCSGESFDLFFVVMYMQVGGAAFHLLFIVRRSNFCGGPQVCLRERLWPGLRIFCWSTMFGFVFGVVPRVEPFIAFRIVWGLCLGHVRVLRNELWGGGCFRFSFRFSTL